MGTNDRFRPSLEALDERALPGALAADDTREPATPLEGDECLVFYLGGARTTDSNVYAVWLTVG